MENITPLLVVNFQLPEQKDPEFSWETADISIGNSGEIYHLFRKQVPLRGRSESGVGYALTQSEPHAYRLQLWKNGAITEHDLGTHEQIFHGYRAMGEDCGLLFNVRCHYNNGEVEKNGIIYDLTHKKILRGITLGDGIASVKTSPSHKIWCTFFDEGIYGNFGWGGKVEPLGHSGLVAFDEYGKKLYDYPLPYANGEKVPGYNYPLVDECYVLNVIDEDAWVCPAEGNIIRVSENKTIEWWNIPESVHGAHAAIQNRQALFCCDKKLYLVALENDHKSSIVREFAYAQIPGRWKWEWCIGVRDSIYLFGGTSVYRIGIPES